MILAEGMRLLTGSELGTLGGAIVAVVAIANGLRYAFGWAAKYVALIASFLAAAFAVMASSDHSWTAWVVAIPNAFIVYAGAAGIATMSLSGRTRATNLKATEEVVPRRRFWGPWFAETHS